MIDEDVKTIALGLILLIAGLTAFKAFAPRRVVEPFSELGLLGPNMKIGDYPRNLTIGESFQLYLYLGNHLGSPQLYRVYVKLGSRSLNISDEEPYPAPILKTITVALNDKTNTTIPLTLAIPREGRNLRLVFEMHRYNPETHAWEYHQRWNQLWLNVTRPD